jgi:two-component system, sensor histidine kinase
MLSRSGLGIRTKLIGIFVLIKVIPLVLLAWFAWQGQVWLADRVSGSVVGMVQQMRETAEIVAKTTTDSAIKALDDAARESMERMTTDVARAVAAFLYDRDADIASAALLPPDAGDYRRFLAARVRGVERHHGWVLAPDGSKWVPGPEATPRYDQPPAQPSLPDQARNFNYRHPDAVGRIEARPLFLEMTFVGLDGIERVKVTSSDHMNAALRDVSRRENTYLKAETYFPALQSLKPGEIYVSDVIGAYVGSPVIGPYTPAAAQKRGLTFAPEQAGYAGVENPVGKRFQGIIRWATPVVRDGKVTGWVTLALDHTHVMEFTDHILPTSDRYSPIPDATSGNYAFIWDYKGRSIVHPRHYFITGYDSQTGEPAPPWLDQGLYDGWKASGQGVSDYLASVKTFDGQSWDKKGAAQQIKAGTLGLDCRYLNHAPQCTGWMDLTQNGGSGSFDIFWSGLWKLTTAAAIPYRTGQYGQSPRGFGFVTIGANVDDFHRAATESRQVADRIVAEHDADLQSRLDAVLSLVSTQVTTMAQQLAASTVMMSAVVVVIAIWMASFLTRRITAVVQGIRRFEDGDMAHRLPVQSQDEMGVLASSFNDMADRVGESFQRAEEARLRAEEASRMKSEFLASMSHELRTPLNGIIGFAELIKDDAADEEVRENAEIIEKSGSHLLNLVNTILDVAKIEAGAMTLARETVDIRTLVTDVAAIHQSGADAKGLDFQVQLADDLPPALVTDPVRVRQVLHNLLSNAVKFTQAGRVHTVVATDTDSVVIRVIDSGPGIALDLQDKIFEKFHQGDAFLTRSHGGTGLGLTLARHLVELMGGEMSLESRVGQGSTFVFTLPAGRP